jgi:hypothetical protein
VRTALRQAGKVETSTLAYLQAISVFEMSEIIPGRLWEAHQAHGLRHSAIPPVAKVNRQFYQKSGAPPSQGSP